MRKMLIYVILYIESHIYDMNGRFLMERKILILATVPSMIVAFNTRNIRILQEIGCSVHVACNFKDRSAWTDQQISEMTDKLKKMNVTMHQIDMPRKPWHPFQLIKAYGQVKRLERENTFYMMHNQSCVSGIIGRIALHKKIPIIMHTEHGFYYFKGGPLINWVFYPFDKLCSKWTDVLITINKDDFLFSKNYMKAKQCVYIPGVGIDTSYYRNTVIDRKEMRALHGIPENAFVISSVGELNENKNHAIIIKAMAKLKIEDIYYVINGAGVERNHLEMLVNEMKLKDNVIFTGNIENVNEYLKMADIFAFPSKREGLGLAALEAMASGLPLVTSNRNGINDYAENGKTGFMCEPDNEEAFADAIKRLYKDKELRKSIGEYNYKEVKKFDSEATDVIMREIYKRLLNG